VEDSINGQAFVEPLIVPGCNGSNLATESIRAELIEQLLRAATVILPEVNVLPNITDTLNPVVSVPGTNLKPTGSVQTYEVALAEAVMLYTEVSPPGLVDDSIKGQAFVGPLIVPGVAGKSLDTANVLLTPNPHALPEETVMLPLVNEEPNIT
jgi:hypothetical protein